MIACNRTWKAPAEMLQYIGALPIVLNVVLREGGEGGADVNRRSEQKAESCHAKIKSRQQATSPV